LRLLLRHKEKTELTEQEAAFAHLINGQHGNRNKGSKNEVNNVESNFSKSIFACYGEYCEI